MINWPMSGEADAAAAACSSLRYLLFNHYSRYPIRETDYANRYSFLQDWLSRRLVESLTDVLKESQIAVDRMLMRGEDYRPLPPYGVRLSRTAETIDLQFSRPRLLSRDPLPVLSMAAIASATFEVVREWPRAIALAFENDYVRAFEKRPRLVCTSGVVPLVVSDGVTATVSCYAEIFIDDKDWRP